MRFTEYDTRLAAYAALLNDEGCLLLTWWNGNGQGKPCWTMPGGEVEYDETLPDAVEREVYEETGYTVSVGAPLALHSFTSPGREANGRPYKSVRVVFAADITGGALGTTEVGGTTDFAEWVPLDQVSALEDKAEIVDVVCTALTRTCHPLVPPSARQPA